ncbi:MAG: peptide chain release factor N(5)-glutamine methyltransferase, partial [Sulfurospirillum sp.]
RGDEMLCHIVDLFQERKAKALACEMGYDQRKPMRLYAQSKGLEIEFYKDLASLDRGFWIKEKK